MPAAGGGNGFVAIAQFALHEIVGLLKHDDRRHRVALKPPIALQLPTQHEMVRRARAMFAYTPSMDVIVSRAHAVILDTIGTRLSAIAAAH